MKKIEESKIEELLKQLTLEEKISMIHGEGLFRTSGVERLEIPPLVMSDGPMGVRKEFQNAKWRPAGTSDDYVTYLPSNSALAATWNRELAKQAGQVLGEEARGRGKDVILAPGINIQRSPLCGRNFEYMSEDPYLISELVVPLIQGIQDGTDTAACVKHFAANAQETERLSVDTQMEERALREIYLPGFRAAIERAGSLTLMGAYNKLRGEHCSHSRQLLDGILRGEWEYDGVVISDWGAVHDTKEAAESSLDIEMSVTDQFDEYYMANPLLKAVRQGDISEETVDAKVCNILRLMFRLNMLGDGAKKRAAGSYNTPEHRQAVLDTARESIILLKNEEQRLPIQTEGLKKLAVIGQNAVKLHSSGGGSAEIKALYEISPLMGLKKLLGGNCEVIYAKGYDVPGNKKAEEVNWQAASLNEIKKESEDEKKARLARTEQERQERYLKEAVELARSSEEVIFIGGLDHEYDVEGKDRQDMKLPYGQDKVIEAVLEANPNTVVVIMAGAPVELSWAERAKAVVWYSYAGMEGGTALAEVLTGRVNPSGKLAVTIPKQLADSPAHKYGEFGTRQSVTFREGIFVGYRYYDTCQVKPRYAFGHGLSYTKFEYQNLALILEEEVGFDYSEKVFTKEDTISPFEVTVSCTVKNTGRLDGAEIVQVYVSDPEATDRRPIHELKGFEKVFLKAGEEKQIEIKLPMESFGFYQEDKKCFVAEAGCFEIQVGAASDDIRLTAEFELEQGYQYQ